MKRSIVLILAVLTTCLIALSSKPHAASAAAEFYGMVTTTNGVYSFTITQGVVESTAAGFVQYIGYQQQTTAKAFAGGILANINDPSGNPQNFIQQYASVNMQRVNRVAVPQGFVDATTFTSVGANGLPGAIISIANDPISKFYLWNTGLTNQPTYVNLGPNNLIAVGHDGGQNYFVRRNDSIELWQGTATSPTPVFNQGVSFCSGEEPNIERLDGAGIGEYCNGLFKLSANPAGIVFWASPTGLSINGVATNHHYMVVTSYYGNGLDPIRVYDAQGILIAQSPSGVSAQNGAIAAADQYIGFCQSGNFKVVDAITFNVYGSFPVSGECMSIQMDESLQIGPDPEIAANTVATNNPSLHTLTQFNNSSMYAEYIEIQVSATAEDGNHPVPSVPSNCYLEQPSSIVCVGTFEPGTYQQEITWTGGTPGQNLLFAVHVCAQQWDRTVCVEDTANTTIPASSPGQKVFIPMMVR